MDEILKISQFINPTLGFFTKMNFDFWYLSKEQLDIMFYANYGDKNPAPIVVKTLSFPPSQQELQKLASMFESLNSPRWEKLRGLPHVEYDPIHNYKDALTETIQNVETGGNTTTGTIIDTGTDTISKDSTRTDNLTNISQLSSDVTTGSNSLDGTYGFNSDEASNADKTVTSGSENEISNNTISNTGTQKNLSTDTDTVDKTKTSDIVEDSHSQNDRTRTSTHSGNIGNLTTQQLMKQEIDLWQWNFMQTVLDDLCVFATLPIYI